MKYLTMKDLRQLFILRYKRIMTMVIMVVHPPHSTNKYTVTFYNPPHDSDGVLWFHHGRPCVGPSVSRTSVRPVLFTDDNE